MKNLLIVVTLCVLIISCTENKKARSFGGTETITLPKGQRLMVATWKQDNLWYLTGPMPHDYVPERKEFTENSSYGIWEGKVIFIESK